jgi:AcrR family transcriptional regulator
VPHAKALSAFARVCEAFFTFDGRVGDWEHFCRDLQDASDTPDDLRAEVAIMLDGIRTTRDAISGGDASGAAAVAFALGTHMARIERRVLVRRSGRPGGLETGRQKARLAASNKQRIMNAMQVWAQSEDVREDHPRYLAFVCQRAEVSVTTIKNHFPNHREIADSLLKKFSDR